VKKNKKREQVGFYDKVDMLAGEVWLLVLTSVTLAMLALSMGARWIPGEMIEFGSMKTILPAGFLFVSLVVCYALIVKKRLKGNNVDTED